MKKLIVGKDCKYCKSKVAHIIVLADEHGESHVHAPSSKPWFNLLVSILNLHIKSFKKRGK